MTKCQEQEKQGEQLARELRTQTRVLAILIGKVPHPMALREAQRTATQVSYMMMDLASTDPETFFMVYPIIEHDLAEAAAVIELMRFRLRQPLVRAKMDPTLRV